MKNFKRIMSLLLVLALAFSAVFALGACEKPDDPDNGDDPAAGDGKTDYTVYVKDEDGNAVSGVTVEILLGGLVSRGSADTDAAGKVSFRLKAEDDPYFAAISNAPVGYEFSEDAVELKNNTATLEVEKLPTYTVYVKNEAGAPIAGVEVQMCDDAGCRLPKTTDAEGKVEFVYAESNFKAQLKNPKIDGYVANSEYHYFTDYVTTITLVAE